jgi:hypothetical protein
MNIPPTSPAIRKIDCVENIGRRSKLPRAAFLLDQKAATAIS